MLDYLSLSRRKFGLFLVKTIIFISVGMTVTYYYQSLKLLKPHRRDRIQITQESGNFLQEVRRLKRLALPKQSHLYQPPTHAELKQFEILTQTLIKHQWHQASRLARKLNYELVEFFDLSTRQIIYGLRENPINGKPLRGWGSYFLNPNYRANALIEAPHVLFDRFSAEIAAEIFLLSAARGLLLGGAHRNANGVNTADVCHLATSVFQIVHQSGVNSGAKTWQIHGFNLNKQSQFPTDTDIVLSNGQGQVFPTIKYLSQIIRQAGFKAYVYNRLLPFSPSNREVNGKVAGHIFSTLGASQNVQGIYSRQRNQTFIHIELSQGIRLHKIQRNQIAKLIADFISPFHKPIKSTL